MALYVPAAYFSESLSLSGGSESRTRQAARTAILARSIPITNALHLPPMTGITRSLDSR